MAKIFFRMRAHELESSQGSFWKEERPWEQGWTTGSVRVQFCHEFLQLMKASPTRNLIFSFPELRSFWSASGIDPWRWPKESKLCEREWKFEEANSWNFCINFRTVDPTDQYCGELSREKVKKRKRKNKERKTKSLECAFTHLGFFTRSAVMKSLACCEMGSKCFGLNSYLTSVILRHVSSTVSPWKGDTPLRLQRKHKNCDKYLFNQYTGLCQTGNFS